MTIERTIQRPSNTAIVVVWAVSPGQADRALDELKDRARRLSTLRYSVSSWTAGNCAAVLFVGKAREFSPREAESLKALFTSAKLPGAWKPGIRGLLGRIFNPCPGKSNPSDKWIPVKVVMPMSYTEDPAGWAESHFGKFDSVLQVGKTWEIYLLPQDTQVDQPRWKTVSQRKGIHVLFMAPPTQAESTLEDWDNPSGETPDQVAAAADLYATIHWGDQAENELKIQRHLITPRGALAQLGELNAVEYLASKGGESANWRHTFDEDGGGDRPRLCVDANRRLFLVGGSYRVEEAGIIG